MSDGNLLICLSFPLYDPSSHSREYFTARGLRLSTVRHTSVSTGEGVTDLTGGRLFVWYVFGGRWTYSPCSTRTQGVSPYSVSFHRFPNDVTCGDHGTEGGRGGCETEVGYDVGSAHGCRE